MAPQPQRTVASRMRVPCGMARCRFFLALLLLGCDPTAPDDAGVDAPPLVRDTPIDVFVPPPRVVLCDASASAPGPYPAPDAFTHHGPGIGPVDISIHPIGEHCAYLDGGETDTADHHNLLVMYDGFLLMPWAPEFGGGGLTFFDISDPCAPTVAGAGTSRTMRETHAIGFMQRDGRRYAVVDQLTRIGRQGGIQFWDITSPAAPMPIADLELPLFAYPDAYARVTLSVSWQPPYVFVGAADTGVHIVDAADPAHPVYLSTHTFEPTLRVGQVQVIGNLLIATAAEGPRTVLLDISDPEAPQPIPGGDFNAVTADGEPRDAYFTTTGGGFVWYAPKESGGGLTVMDIHDPESPTFVTDYRSDGNGGYVFLHEGLAFVGESSIARVYDVSAIYAGTPDFEIAGPMMELNLQGDLDTASPIGHVVVLSVDEDAIPDQGSAIVPLTDTSDTRSPLATWVWPNPDASSALPIAPTSRFGVTFDEAVDALSAHEGSVRLYRADAASPDEGRIPGLVSAQEQIVHFHPLCPLERGVEYILELPAGGVTDYAGNPLESTLTYRFHT